MADKKLYQSASRNETYQTCTALYGAKYLWKLPDPGNDGANRGNVVHEVLELLIKPRHRHLYEDLVHKQSAQEVPAVWRYVRRLARKYGVDDQANRKQIDAFIITGIMNEFLGPKGTIELIGEQEFRLEVDEDGKRYNVRGYIDKLAKVLDDMGIALCAFDYKTSKTKFDGDKETFNTQNIVYLLALKRMYPEITRRRFRFLFLKFPKDPWQEVDAFTDVQLEGYEYLLTIMQERLEAFTEKNMFDKVAAFDEEHKWLCGREGTKKDGTPMWMCPARRPRDYWVVLDKDGSIIASADTKEELTPKEGETIEQKHWPGCPAWYGKNGQRIQSQ